MENKKGNFALMVAEIGLAVADVSHHHVTTSIAVFYIKTDKFYGLAACESHRPSVLHLRKNHC